MSKTQYWFEDDIEAEWESTRAHTTRETSQYETEQSAEDAMMDASAPVALDMGDVRDVQTGVLLGCSTFCKPSPSPPFNRIQNKILVL